MATPSVDPPALTRPLPDPVDYSENDDEVDQLDSDSDVVNHDASSVSSQKEGAGERLPGHSLLPVMRLENIIQADGVTGNLSMSKEALFVLSVATEEFVKRMSQAGHRSASVNRRNVVTYRDMAMTTRQYQEFMFLCDTIPSPLTLSDALQRRDAKEREFLEEDPAVSTSLSTRVPGPLAIHPYNSKGKAKTRNVNGKEKLNGSSSSSKKERRSRDVNGRWSYGNEDPSGDRGIDGVEVSWPTSTWSDEHPFRPIHSQAPQNGMSSTSTSYLHEGEYLHQIRSIPPIRSLDEQADRSSSNIYHPTFHPQEEATTWPGQYTGPASGFLQAHGPFGQIPGHNTGRTIYSQQDSNDSNAIR